MPDPIPTGKLVLGRQENESIILTIGNITVKVTVAEIRGSKVRLGFDAPHCVSITREELRAEVDARVKAIEKPRKPMTHAEVEAVCAAVSGVLEPDERKLSDETLVALAVGRCVEAVEQDGECWVRATAMIPKRLEEAVIARLKTEPRYEVARRRRALVGYEPHVSLVAADAAEPAPIGKAQKLTVKA